MFHLNRHAYNVPIRELIVLVVKAILDLPLQSTDSSLDERRYLEHITSALNHLIPLLNNYTKSTESQKDCLSSIEHFAVSNPTFCSANVLVRILLKLYESDVLTDEIIIDWHQQVLPFPPPLNTNADFESRQQTIRSSKPLVKLIDWLQQEQDESSDDEDESD